ncbi:tRNA:m(4)X modification enzyme TRM13 homolog isoform X2 [Symsagittifera roscoffensis]|uniref:tRNA:m(4)X modification enzyme TRM13 homolog isoform X2 n=1 Tax=Symsagittifera roscoffensis TaxID=84072 RepID=UPI00307B507A
MRRTHYSFLQSGPKSGSSNKRHNPNKSGALKRVRCPLDPKHTVCESKLTKHMKICNSRDPVELPYFKKNVNLIPQSDATTVNSFKMTASSTSSDFSTPSKSKMAPSPEEVSAIVNKIEPKFGLKSSNSLVKQFLDHPKVFLDEADRDFTSKKGKEAYRHVLQIGSLLRKLEVNNYFENDNTLFIEMGAGRGQLSYWAAVVKDKKLPILLVDNANVKNKFDHHYKYDSPEFYQRINMNIGDLDLSEVPFLKQFNNKNKINEVESCSDTLPNSRTYEFLMATKHLCGAATDFAITCAVNFARKSAQNIPDMLLTFCCHHRCSWESYVGKQFFLENSFTAEDFHIMSRISAWYTCGDKWHAEHTNSNEGAKNENEEYNNLKYSAEEKERIGLQCKYLINLGRLKYLEGLGMKCEMYNYVDSSVTLENVALLAKFNS